jgi:cell wall-associated NlpC family hydrolase
MACAPFGGVKVCAHVPMGEGMPRFASSLAACLVLLVLMPGAAAAHTLGNWNPGEQRAAVRAGVLAPLGDGRVHGERPLSGSELWRALAALAGREGTAPVAAPSGATVTVTAFDARLVAQLGLSDVAAHVQAVARGAGLAPQPSFGAEVVARFLGLREDHPAADDAIELYPWDPITRAEAAHSFAVMLHGPAWEASWARQQLSAFALPGYTAPERRALSLAVSKVGMPYIWGGETDAASSFFGYQAHGGYDCSGLVWRVFKLSGNPAGRRIGGRTAAQMAGEIPRSQRIRLDQVRPGDLLFFGSAGFRSRASEASIVHVGIALSPHWMVHSSSQGVYVSSLDDSWRRAEFAWARRVL